MKCLILFSRKNKNNISLSSAEFAHNMVLNRKIKIRKKKIMKRSLRKVSNLVKDNEGGKCHRLQN